MGDVGGIKAALFSIGFLLSSYVNAKLLHAAIISKILNFKCTRQSLYVRE